MKAGWKTVKTAAAFVLVAMLVFSSGLFSVLLYGKVTGQNWTVFSGNEQHIAYAEVAPSPAPTAAPQPKQPEKKPSAVIDAPLVKQLPELFSGCEVTSLTMLLLHKGIDVSKMELVSQLKKDPTPVKMGENGEITHWGDPNVGFVGDITGRLMGYAVYHAPLFELLKQHVPTAVDLTGESFDRIERQISEGIPVVVWNTIDFAEPSNWMEWASPTGTVRGTMMEHAVLLVGYDATSVYVNDPLSGQKQAKLDKERFIRVWETMGKQAISYAE